MSMKYFFSFICIDFNFFHQCFTIFSPTTGYISKGHEISMSKRFLLYYVHCSITHNSQDMESTYMSVHGSIKKMQYTVDPPYP